MPITADRMTQAIEAGLRIHQTLKRLNSDILGQVRFADSPADALAAAQDLAATALAETQPLYTLLAMEYKHFYDKRNELAKKRRQLERKRRAAGMAERPQGRPLPALLADPLAHLGKAIAPDDFAESDHTHIPSIYIDPARIAQAEAELDAQAQAQPQSAGAGQPAGAGRLVDSNTEPGPWASPDTGFLELGDMSNGEDGAEEE